MHLSQFKLENYKSFRSSEDLLFTPGFNVIIGPNDVGKTALVEGLSLAFANVPHQSEKTRPYPEVQPPQVSRAHCTVHLAGAEIRELLLTTQRDVLVLWHSSWGEAGSDAYFNALLTSGADLAFSLEPSGNILNVQLLQYPTALPGEGFRYTLQHDAERWAPLKVGRRIEEQDAFPYVLATLICSSIYMFRAERAISGDAPIAPDDKLVNNASNLATVLHYLQTDKPFRFEQFKGLVREVFPHIQQIRVPPHGVGPQARIYIGTIEPGKGREDLDIPLAASGTGIGHMLAMLYVVFTAEFPRIIVIDEPQSFLHPGDIYRLFNILKTQYAQHQYILTTHAPAVVAAAEPTTSFFLTWSQGEAAITPVNYDEATGLQDVLDALGVRLTDVFGADRLVWVEGMTEERCFPMIYSALIRPSLGGTRFVSVLNTGDLEAKDPDRILGIYERLSQGSVLMPPTVGFLFDRELRTPQQCEDLKRRGKGTVAFLERRMYENYLLDPAAIAKVLNHADPSGDTHITPSQVEEWLRLHGQSDALFKLKPPYPAFPEEAWYTEVHGAQVLATLFETFSESRVQYGKTQHGREFTRWFLDHKRETLQPIADAIRALLA